MSDSATDARLTMLPPVARLGFEDGWMLLSPTFLNLQRPVLLVDKVHIGPTTDLGLEPFGLRDPLVKLPMCRIDVAVAGNGISLWIDRRRSRSLLAAGWFEAVNPHDICANFGQVIVLLGDTYAIEASWSALWTCEIGIGRIGQGEL